MITTIIGLCKFTCIVSECWNYKRYQTVYMYVQRSDPMSDVVYI